MASHKIPHWIWMFGIACFVFVRVGVNKDSDRASAEQTVGSGMASIAVVDVNMVFSSYSKTQHLNKQMVTAGDALKSWEVEQKGDLTRLRAEMEALKPGSKAYAKIQSAIQRKKIEIQVTTRSRNEELKDKQCRAMIEIYKEIVDCVQKVAMKKRVLLVLRMDATPTVRPSIRSIQMQIANHKVLYADKTVDLTQEVLEELERGKVGNPR